MKIVVIGGTGLIGSKVVEKLKHTGHEAIAAAPNTGVNTITGEGLADALAGAPRESPDCQSESEGGMRQIDLECGCVGERTRRRRKNA